MNAPNFLLFNSRDELLRIEISCIAYFEADGNYTRIVQTNKLCNTVGMSLVQTERLLSEKLKDKAQCFARIGKKYIVNLNYVHQINLLKQRLVLSDGRQFVASLDISKEALKKLKDIMLTGKVPVSSQTT